MGPSLLKAIFRKEFDKRSEFVPELALLSLRKAARVDGADMEDVQNPTAHGGSCGASSKPEEVRPAMRGQAACGKCHDISLVDVQAERGQQPRDDRKLGKVITGGDHDLIGVTAEIDDAESKGCCFQFLGQLDMAGDVLDGIPSEVFPRYRVAIGSEGLFSEMGGSGE